MFAGHKVAPVQLRSGTLEIHFPCLHVECDRPVCFAGESRSPLLPWCSASLHGGAAPSRAISDALPIEHAACLGEVCEPWMTLKVVVNVQMVFFHIQNGGVSGAVGMKRTIGAKLRPPSSPEGPPSGRWGFCGFTWLPPPVEDLGPDDERGFQAGVQQGVTAHCTGGAFAMGSGN